MEAQVEIISKEFIKPSSPTPLHRKHHRLSFIDRLPTAIHLPLILFYQNHPAFDQSQISHLLKQSLSDSLVKFYPLAGRIQENNVFVDCNDSGVLYIEARVHTSLSKATQNFVIEEFNQYLPIVPYDILYANKELKRDFPLAVQINFFDCGGIGVAVCISHRVADALSDVMFLNSWAATCRADDESKILKPNFDLGCLHFPPPDDFPAAPPLISVAKKEKFVAKRFVFNKEMLENLKELAASEESNSSVVKDPSRVEVLSAFLSKTFIELDKVKVDSSKSIFVGMHNVNLRPKLKLPHDEFAFGNIAVPISTLVMPEMGKEFHDLIGHWRNAIRGVNDDFVKNIVQTREPYLRILTETRKLLLSKEENSFCNFTSWCRFPVYEVDFGWGKPFSFGTASVPRKNTMILMSTKCGDGIEAWINMAEDDIGRLPKEFLSLENHDF